MDDRKLKVLAAVVDEYIRTGEPVGSKTISQLGHIKASSATIRNDMAMLEQLGYLEQPHTSAGRIPTYLGYRLYIDELMTLPELSDEEKQMLDERLGGEDTPAIGFAMGMERLASLLGEKQEERLTAYIVSNNTLEAVKLTQELRQKGISCEFDLTNKKFVKQLEKASKVSKYAVILGEDEISKGEVTVKNLDTSEQTTVKREELKLS